MKLKLILPIFIILIQTGVYGQIINPDSVFEPKLCGKQYEMTTGYKGSQYYNAEWANADILLSNGEMAVNKLVKYNGFIDELIWKNTMNLMEVQLEKHFVDAFELKNYKGKTIQFKRKMVKLPVIADSAELFVEVLAERRASCYVYRKIVIKGYDLNEIEGKTYISYDLIAQPQYLLILPDKQVVIFKRISKHAVLKALPENYRIFAKSLLQKNHLQLRSEDDLKMLTGLIE